MSTVALIGSTGSIGTQALDVIRADPGRYRVIALAAHRSVDTLAAQAAEFHPDVIGITDESKAQELAARLPAGTDLVVGPDALTQLAQSAEVVLNAVVGFAGLPVTLVALRSGRRLALANKESLIAGGPVVQAVRGTAGSEIIPVDSEHCAIHQCLRASSVTGEVRRLLLTASGGPFRGKSADDLARVSVADALAHPTWTMGPKITVDSSTLMNKGLEVIEAHELFGVGYDAIDVVVHRQSVVHSMVEFTDGATIAQLSMPDMRLPIAYALAYPERSATPFGGIDWSALRSLDFEVPDRDRFPALGLAYEAGRVGGTAPAWLNAANEVAVAAFLDERISWLSITSVIQGTMDAHDGAPADGVDAVLEADRRARQTAQALIERNRAA